MRNTYLSPEDSSSLGNVAKALVLLGQYLKAGKPVNADTINVIASSAVVLILTIDKARESEVPASNN